MLGHQQASSKRQASNSARPFSGPKATGLPKSGEKMLPRFPGWCSALSREQIFFSVGPPPVETVIEWYFRKIPGRAKNRKTPFPGARGTCGEKKCYHLAIRDCFGTTDNQSWAMEGPCLGRRTAPCARVAVPGVGPKPAQNGPKSPKTGPGASVGAPRRFHCSS